MSYGVEALLKQRGDIDSELKKHKSPVTLMFTDLAGSSALGTEQLRGKSGKETVYEIAWTDAETYAKLRQRFPPKAAAQQEELSEGRYQVLGEIGHGAMGVVYRAYDRVIGRVVAMKTI